MRIPINELMMLGSTILKPMRGRRWSEDKTAGCALGMAEAALGLAKNRNIELAQGYRWLRKQTDVLPCKCELHKNTRAAFSKNCPPD